MGRAKPLERLIDVSILTVDCPCCERQNGGADRSRTDRVHPDPVGGMVERHCPGQRMDRPFRRDIGGDVLLAGVSLHRRNIDDRPAAAFHHFGNAVVRRQVDRPDINGHRRREGRGLRRHHRPIGMHGSGVDDDIQSAEGVHSRLHRGLNLDRNGHVDPPGPDVEAALGGNGIQGIVGIAVDAAGNIFTAEAQLRGVTKYVR